MTRDFNYLEDIKDKVKAAYQTNANDVIMQVLLSTKGSHVFQTSQMNYVLFGCNALARRKTGTHRNTRTVPCLATTRPKEYINSQIECLFYHNESGFNFPWRDSYGSADPRQLCGPNKQIAVSATLWCHTTKGLIVKYGVTCNQQSIQ